MLQAKLECLVKVKLVLQESLFLRRGAAEKENEISKRRCTGRGNTGIEKSSAFRAL
jgi:hypothetical protein